MKYKWLNKENNKKLIIFFNGWGMDECVVEHLEPGDYDVIMLYDYNSLEFDFSFVQKYSEKYLIAWSMGVMCASNFDIEYNSSTAINGTLKPIDNSFGIPERIYDLTLNNLSPASSKKFIRNMFKEAVELPKINREFDNIKKELEALRMYNTNLNFKYNRVIISNEDKIIPTKNQLAFWNVLPNVDSGHCPFFKYKKWSELI